MPPNTLAALTATITGRNANAVFATISRKLYQSDPSKEGINFPSASTSPIIRPEATIAGRIGTNTSPIDLSALFQAGCCAAAAALTSSFVAADIPVTARNSSYTLFTVPVPMMSWSCPLFSNIPLTPSTFSSADFLILPLSLITSLSLVAQ